MTKYNLDFKLEIIKARNEQSLGYQALANMFHINRAQVQLWVKRYQAHGIEGLKPRQRHRKYTPEFKLKIIQKMITSHWSIKQTALHFDISSPSLITQWFKKYNQSNQQGLIPKPKGRPRLMKTLSKIDKILSKSISDLTQDELIERLKYLEAENAFLKKLEALEKKKAEQKSQKSSPL